MQIEGFFFYHFLLYVGKCEFPHPDPSPVPPASPNGLLLWKCHLDPDTDYWTIVTKVVSSQSDASLPQCKL